jgi:nitrile hydratase alpha subunit
MADETIHMPIPAHHEGHDHDLTFQPDEEESLGHYGVMEMAVRELMIEKGILDAGEFRQRVERIDELTPAMGAKVVARAWTDADFKKRLLENPTEAVTDFGIVMGHVVLYVVENTSEVHNVVVCTLCSCYPKPLLGAPPDWYKSRNYRTRTVSEPRKVLAEFGTIISDDKQVRVHDSTADLRYMVLPERPEGTEGMSVEELEALVTRDSMIGVVPASAIT